MEPSTAMGITDLSAAAALAELVRFPSVSAISNADVSERVHQWLASMGFAVEVTEYRDEAGVAKVNLVARRDPQSRSASTTGGLAYFCHTDVVPVADWNGPGGDPFEAVVTDDRIYGRGSCDMKGSLVSMMQAASRISAADQTAPLWIVCTADEEVGFEGATHMVHHSPAYREIVESQPLAIIGEPTGLRVVHAHKGITGFSVTSKGRAAHSSTDEGVNANIAITPIMELLCELAETTRTDPSLADSRFDPPHLSWTFGISDGCTAVNITPGRSVAWCSLRPMPDINGESLIARVESEALRRGLTFRRFKGGHPVWIEPDADCIESMCQIAGGPPMTVCYGTDGGEFDELDQRVIFGPGNIAQAHTTDEWISLDQLHRGTELYAQAIRRWCMQD
ncbi:Acetylornithine deacetylase [Rubripirellula tenax]|uniref:Acetylornithine deacetylase n=1 Tax=Rubripirellula tenax TaxID=2528015 RepID=A0A5C6FBJ3_9BACT|nr:M20 family metallopeptidase [Rubripirellula tenax]TWU57001.1 Acetylornithine deacetylase [Rubripirellula tenax]